MTRERGEGEALLHHPARRGNLESIETHLHSAAGLCRALWELLTTLDEASLDPRTKLALEELASAAADHASAALYCFYSAAAAPEPPAHGEAGQ
jgi:hypothetical protein